MIREGESYLVGPLLDGRFLPAKISTIHRYRVPRQLVRAAQAASLSLLHIGGSRLRKVGRLLALRSSNQSSVGHGDCFFHLESSRLFRVHR